MLYINDLRNSIEKLIKNDEKIYLIGEDISEPYGGAFKVTKDLSNIYPEKFIQTPMSEQGFTGMAIGMALNGLKPIVEIMFGDFITLTADQIINHLSKFSQMYDKKLNFVLRTPSGGYRGYGATHSQSLEVIFMSIPGIEIISPSILNSPGMLLEKSVNYNKPIIFIENKLDYSQNLIKKNIYKDLIIIEKHENNNWIYSKSNIIEESPKLTIITHGGMTKILLKIQEDLFMNEEIPVELISLSNLNNIDFKNLSDSINSENILIVEESIKNFGWGSHLLIELLKIKLYKKFDNIGSKSCFIPASKSLEEFVLPTEKYIIKKILQILGDEK